MSKFQYFRVALAVADMTQAEWAIQHHFHPVTVSQVARGEKSSRRIEALIDGFIREQFKYLPNLSTEVLGEAA